MRGDVICILKSRRFPLGKEEISDGGTINVAHLVDELLTRDVRLEVFTRREPGHPAIWNAGAMTVHYVDYEASPATDTFQRDFEEGVSFVRSVVHHPAFRPTSYVCIHSHHWTSAVGLEEVLPSWVRLVHTPHLLAIEKALHLQALCPEEIKAAEAALLRRADVVIALSATERSALEDWYGVPVDRVKVIPNGVSSPFFDVPMAPIVCKQSPMRLVSIARLCRQKGIEVLLDAMELLIGSGIETSLTVVGGSYNEPLYERHIRERADALPLRGHVSFLGHVSHRRIPEILERADIYVQPSRYESQGIAVLEAMAAGRAVVVSDLPAVREFLVHDVTGVLVQSGEPRILAAALADLWRHPSKRVSFAHAARQRARAFTWARTVAETMDVVWEGQS